jgi:hypothetical protein
MATYSIRDIDNLSADQYAKKLLHEQGFREIVEKLEAERRIAAQRRGTLDSLGTPGK